MVGDLGISGSLLAPSDPGEAELPPMFPGPGEAELPPMFPGPGEAELPPMFPGPGEAELRSSRVRSVAPSSLTDSISELSSKVIIFDKFFFRAS